MRRRQRPRLLTKGYKAQVFEQRFYLLIIFTVRISKHLMSLPGLFLDTLFCPITVGNDPLPPVCPGFIISQTHDVIMGAGMVGDSRTVFCHFFQLRPTTE